MSMRERRRDSECHFSLTSSRGLNTCYSEETETDVYDRMVMIQENEVMQLKDLTSLLDLEIAFAQQHLEVLKDVRQNWVDEYVSRHCSYSCFSPKPCY